VKMRMGEEYGMNPQKSAPVVTNRIMPTMLVGRALRFRLVDLERYLQEQTSTYWRQVDGQGRPAARGAAEEDDEG
jgi:hypothetical protein